MNDQYLNPKTDNLQQNRPPYTVFSVSALILTLLLIPLTNLFPLHGPGSRTWISSIPSWLHPLLLFPSDHLIPDPLIRLAATLAVGAVLFYVLLDFRRSFQKTTNTYILRESVIWVLIGLFVIVPLMATMMKRFDQENSVYSHDGGIYQTTEAIEMLLNGRNPYTHDYQGLYMKTYAAQSGIDEPLYHNPYLPGSFLLPLPIYFMSNALFGMHFQRLFYLLCYLGLLLIVRSMSSGENRLSMLVAIGLNPAVAYFLHQGRNDIGLAVLLVATVWCVSRRWPVMAGVLFGCACSYKQLAWFTVPFLWIFLASIGGDIRRNRMKAVGAAVLVMLALVGPFVVWDASALYDDTFAFNAGSSAHPYKLGGTPGFGASNLLLVWNAVESRASYFPFTIPMLLVGIPLIVVLCRLQLQQNNRAMLFGAMALVSFAIPYFSRFFHDNYFALISIFVVVAVFGDRHHIANVSSSQLPKHSEK